MPYRIVGVYAYGEPEVMHFYDNNRLEGFSYDSSKEVTVMKTDLDDVRFEALSDQDPLLLKEFDDYRAILFPPEEDGWSYAYVLHKDGRSWKIGMRLLKERETEKLLESLKFV